MKAYLEKYEGISYRKHLLKSILLVIKGIRKYICNLLFEIKRNIKIFLYLFILFIWEDFMFRIKNKIYIISYLLY